jgi:amino acid transporter
VSDTAGFSGKDVVVIAVRRQVGLLGLLGLMFFTVSGGAYGLESMISTSGPGMALLLLLVTPIIWSVPAALMVAELSTAMPVEGGYYQWVKAGLGRYWGYQEAFWSWISSWVDMAIYPVLFATYLAQTYVPAAGAGTMVFAKFGPIVIDLHWVICMAVIWVFTLVNIRGARVVGDSSLVFMILLLAPFVVMVAIGIPQLFIHHINPLHPFTPVGTSAATAFGAGLWICMWNYLGWDGLSTVGGEIENPRRTFPRALAIMIPLITLIYILPVLAGLAGGTDWQGWTTGYFPVLGGHLAGPWLEASLVIGALISASGLYAGLLVSVSRLPFVLARDGYLPKALTREHHRYGTPWVAIVVASVIYSVFCFGAFSALVVVDVFVYSVALMLEFAALIILRVRLPDMERPFKVPFGWPGIFVITLFPSLVIAWAIYQTIIGSGLKGMYLSFGALAIGPLTYPFAKRFIQRGRKVEPVIVNNQTIWSED